MSHSIRYFQYQSSFTHISIVLVLILTIPCGSGDSVQTPWTNALHHSCSCICIILVWPRVSNFRHFILPCQPDRCFRICWLLLASDHGLGCENVVELILNRSHAELMLNRSSAELMLNRSHTGSLMNRNHAELMMNRSQVSLNR